MMTYEHDENLLIKEGQLFPNELCDDLWVAYHGTSGIFEQEIDKNGLRWSPQIASRAEVGAIVGIFEKISWAGQSAGGLPVLKPFTLGHDFGDSDVKPIFLAESSLGALTFATHEFAGGETARALRFCFRDLHQYLSSPDLRQEHTIMLWKRAKSLCPIPIPPEFAKLPTTEVQHRHVQALWNYCLEAGAPLGDPPQEIELEWLLGELNRHARLEKRCVAAYMEHRYGVVYAVRFAASDLNMLKYDSSMGLKALCSIPVNQIVAKVRIPLTCRVPLREDSHGFKALFGDGVVGRLRSGDF